jgi:streptogramin lyase
MNGPTGIGVDSKGNVWVASYNGSASKFSPTGSPLLPSGVSGYGLNHSYGLAIDSSDNVWIPNQDSASTVNNKLGSVTELNSNGQPLSGSTGFIAGGIAFPVALAVDPNGTIWVLNYNNARVTQLSSSGTPLSGATGYGASSLAFIVSIAIDGNHNAWIGGQNDPVVTRMSYDGTQSLAISCCDGIPSLAIDQRNNVWASNFFRDSVSQVSTSGTVVSSGYSAGGLARPQAIAIDGAGSVWVAGLRSVVGASAAALAQFAGAGSPTSPGVVLSPASGWLADADMLQPYAIAIDASGNLWISQYNTDNEITQVIGMAAPVKTPLLGPVQTP